MHADLNLDKADAAVLASDNAFKLALFSFNIGGGLVMSDAEGLAECTWEESRRLALAAEAAGFDALVPLARWRGHGGRTNPAARSFEAFTWAAAVSAVTSTVQVFATFHVPAVHPVMAAKMAATIDHISGGRFGLNIVAGWQPDELAMFGAAKHDHDERYAVADEWATIVQRLWAEDDAFDFEGKFFQAPGAYSNPKPLQRPGPVIMSAGISPAGRDFASKHADMIFAAINDPAKTAQTVSEIKDGAREKYGREMKVFGVGHITCRDTEQEAKAYYDHVINEHGDWDAAKSTVGKLMANSQTVDYASAKMQGLMEGAIRAFFAAPLTGTPEQIADAIAEMASAGLEGLAITFNDYDDGLERYREQILPLLVARGLREPLPSSV